MSGQTDETPIPATDTIDTFLGHSEFVAAANKYIPTHRGEKLALSSQIIQAIGKVATQLRPNLESHIGTAKFTR